MTGRGLVSRLAGGPALRAALIAAAVAILAYANAPANGFAYDDVHIVVEDAALGEPGAFPERLLEPYWPADAAGDLGLWRPLTTLAFGVQRRVFGLEPAGFHAVNVLLHGAVTALVVLLAVGLVPVPAALLAGLIFAVHPVHVEAVANVVGLAEILAAVPYLGACVLFLRATGGSREADHRDGAGVGGEGAGPTAPAPGPAVVVALAALYALAFLTKESAVTLPAALVLLDLVRRPVPVREMGRYLRDRGPLLLALALTAVAVLALRFAVLGSVASPDPPLGARRLVETPRIWTLGLVWLHYLRLLVVPLELSADYSPGVVPVLTVWTPAAVAGVLGALAAFVGSLVAWRRGNATRHRLPALAVVWFLVAVSPVSNVLFVTGVLLAERTLYIPSVGFAIAAGWGLAWLARHRGWVGRVVVVGVLLLLAARSWTRTPTWESTERVFLTLAADHPESGRAQWMVGDMLAARGDLRRAKGHWARAVGHLDSTPWLLREIGWGAVERGEERLGEHLLLRAWEEEGGSRVTVARRLAVLYSRQGRHERAATFARTVLERDPGNVTFWHLLAGSLEATGSYDDAVAARRRVIELGEDPWQQWHSLARLLLTTGDTAAARAAIDEALERAPGAAERSVIQDGFVPLETSSRGPAGG